MERRTEMGVETAGARGGLSREKKIRYWAYSLASGELVFLMVSFLAHKYMHRYLGFRLVFPTLDFLFNRIDRLADFYNLYNFTKALQPYQAGSSYPPFGLALFLPFGWLVRWFDGSAMASLHVRQLSYVPFALAFVVPLCWILWHELRTKELPTDLFTLLVVMFSVPVAMVIERGNTMFLSLFFLYVFLDRLKRNRTDMVAVIALGAAIAARIYPAVFLLLLIRDRKYKQAAQSIGVAVALSVASFPLFQGGIIANFRRFIQNLFAFQAGAQASAVFRSDIFSLHFTSSFKALIKIPVMLLNHGRAPAGVPVDQIYVAFQVLLIVLVVWYVLREETRWKQVFLLTTLMVMVPSVSYEHNLLYFLLPLILWANDSVSERSDAWMVVLFGLLFVPKNFYVLFFDPPYYPITINSVINTSAVLIALLVYFGSTAKQAFSFGNKRGEAARGDSDVDGNSLPVHRAASQDVEQG